MSKALDISNAKARDLLKALVILSDTTIRRSAVDQEDLNHTENQKKGYFSLGDQQVVIYRFFKDFSNHRKKTNREVVLTVDLSATFLSTETTNDHLPTIWKMITNNHLPTIWKRRLLQTYIEGLNEQLVCMKFQAHSSLEPPLEYNQN